MLNGLVSASPSTHFILGSGLARCLMHALAEEASRLKCYKARKWSRHAVMSSSGGDCVVYAGSVVRFGNVSHLVHFPQGPMVG